MLPIIPACLYVWANTILSLAIFSEECRLMSVHSADSGKKIDWA